MQKAKMLRLLSLPAVALASGSAMAAIDTTAAVAGVADAQAAVVVVIGAMITMAIAIYGLKRVWRLFGG